MTLSRLIARLESMLAGLMVCLFGMAVASGAQAQASYPVKPIRLIVAFAPGSSTDAVARIVAEELGRRLKQNVIVENRAGANGQIASAFVAQSAPDGYTLMISSNTTHAANPHLYKKLPYDPVKDFVPIARLGYIPFMLLVHPSVPVKNTAELIAYAKSRPGQLTYASSNSTGQVSMETLNVLKGTDIVGVSYKSSQQAMIDLVGNQVQIMVCDFAVAQPQLKAGKVRALAVPSAKRSRLRPDLPAMAETIGEFNFTPWNGFWAPAGTPGAIVARLGREIGELAQQPAIRSKLAAIGIEVAPLVGEAFSGFISSEIAHWGRLVRAAGIRPE